MLLVSTLAGRFTLLLAARCFAPHTPGDGPAGPSPARADAVPLESTP